MARPWVTVIRTISFATAASDGAAKPASTSVMRSKRSRRNRFERSRIVDSGGRKGVAIDINGETEWVAVVRNELRETPAPSVASSARDRGGARRQATCRMNH